jgi:ribonuclease G
VEAIIFEINPLVNEYIKEKKHGFEKVLKENFNIEIILKENRDIFFDELKIVRMGSRAYVESYIREKY